MTEPAIARPASSPPSRRAGMTLLEVMISLVIFATVVVLSTQMMLASYSFSGLDSAEKQMEINGEQALEWMSKDICNSSWWPVASGTVATNLTTFPRVWKNNDAARSNAASPSFPYGDCMTLMRLRSETSINSNPTTLYTTKVNFNAPEYTTVAATGASSTTMASASPSVSGALPAPFPATTYVYSTPMSQYWNGVPILSLMLNPTWIAGTTLVWPNWESSAPQTQLSSTTAGPNWTSNEAIATLRQYRYVVVPNTIGLGTLVRQWNNTGSSVDTAWPAAVYQSATAANINATVLVDNVQSVTFDTYLTEPDTSVSGINPDQVRITLVLAEVLNNEVYGNNAAAVVTRTLSAYYSLRSITTSTE
jgi:prepilin-type N-terminal cleavage/methylation domain-containing protein